MVLSSELSSYDLSEKEKHESVAVTVVMWRCRMLNMLYIQYYPICISKSRSVLAVNCVVNCVKWYINMWGMGPTP